MDCRTALTVVQAVINRMAAIHPELEQANQTLGMILEQVGCEHFDPACEDGRLTTLMDIIIF